jgi:hypothetical protein
MLGLSTLGFLAQSLGDDSEQPVGDQLFARRVGLAKGTVEKQRGQTVHSSPRGFVETIAPIGGEHAGGNQIVNTPDEDLERMVISNHGVSAVCLARVAGVRRIRIREGGPEQARFSEGKVDVALPGGAQAPKRAIGLGPSAGHRVQPSDHRVGQSRLRVLFHRSKECVAIGVVPVRRGVAHPGHPLDVAQHHRLRPARPGQFDGVIEQRLPQISMVIRVGGGA